MRLSCYQLTSLVVSPCTVPPSPNQNQLLGLPVPPNQWHFTPIRISHVLGKKKSNGLEFPWTTLYPHNHYCKQRNKLHTIFLLFPYMSESSKCRIQRRCLVYQATFKHNNLDQPGYTVIKGKTILQTRLVA